MSYRQAHQQLCLTPLPFDQALSKQDRPDEWCVAVTTVFLKALHQGWLAQASLVRMYATVRHGARWLYRKFLALFLLRCPAEGVTPPAEPAVDLKGLTRLEERNRSGMTGYAATGRSASASV